MRAPLLAALLLCGCGAGPRSPEGAVRALVEAAGAGERDDVWALLGPSTRARLETDARRAADLSGRRKVSPLDLLAVGWAAPHDRAASIREVDRTGDRAEVEVKSEHGQIDRVTCVRVGGAWRVELP